MNDLDLTIEGGLSHQANQHLCLTTKRLRIIPQYSKTLIEQTIHTTNTKRYSWVLLPFIRGYL